MEGLGGHIALFLYALGAFIGWLTSRRKGSATLNLLLVIALAAICVVGWRLIASSSDAPSLARPDSKEVPQEALATPPPALRTPASTSAGAIEGEGGAQEPASRTEQPALDEEAWRQSFANASVDELMAASEALRAEAERKAGPILDSMHAAGHSEYIGPVHEYEGGPGDEEAILRVYMPHDGGTYRMELPRTHYPELYALKARALWLEDLARKTKQG